VHVRRLELAIALGLGAFFLATVLAAGTYQPEARLLPWVVGVPALGLVALQVTRVLRAPIAAADAHVSGVSGADLQAVVWWGLFAVVVILGGVLAGGVVAVFVTQRFWLRESTRTALVGALVAVSLLYFGFERQLGVGLFRGLLAGWLL
jgi:hypothetical protein